MREATHKFPNGTGCIELVKFFFKVFATVKHKYFLEQFFFGDGNIIDDVCELCLDVRIIVKKGITAEFVAFAPPCANEVIGGTSAEFGVKEL